MKPIFEKYYDCGGCPCLNSDTEDGTSCNLGYDINYGWDANGTIFHHISQNCELISITFKGGKIRRGKEQLFTRNHPRDWNEEMKEKP